MSDVARLLSEVEQVGRGSVGRRSRALSGVVDLFVVGASGLDGEHLALFDAVFERLLARAEEPARAAVAERLAPLPYVPPGTLKELARDEIVVARPILTVSPCISDQDLVAVCIAQGRDHMLAICERTRLSELVTDVLVQRGDAVVHHAVTANPTARFSRLSVATLVELARADLGLLELLGERRDLPDLPARQLAGMLRAVAERQLNRALDAAPGPADPSGDNDLAAVLNRVKGGALPTEITLAEDARQGRGAAVLAGLAFLSGLPVERARRLYEERDDELLVAVARARGWSFDTVRAIMSGRSEPADPHHLWRTERSFANLSPSTALRILRFVRLQGGRPMTVGQRRSNVR